MSEGVLRFSVTERALHWAFASGYLLLLASGLPLMVPALRGWIRGYSPLVGELTTLEPGDGPWLRRFPRWLVATAVERARLDRAVGRFNAGQKINAVFTLVTASLLLVTGIALWPFGADGLWRAAHRWLTVLVLIPIAGHIFLAAVHPSTRHALTGMLDGRVDREWAATHHPRWGPQ